MRGAASGVRAGFRKWVEAADESPTGENLAAFRLVSALAPPAGTGESNSINTLNRRKFFGLAALGAATVSCRRPVLTRLPAFLPPSSSWERVPVYGHLGKSNGDFTSEELDFLVAHFNFICIEKGQAVITRGCTEEGIYEAARQLKRRNPKARVLFYWNAFINYPLYRALDRFQPAWTLKDRNGNEVRNNFRLSRPDLSLPEVREWWSDAAAEAMRAAPLDGIFADALPQVLTPALPGIVGKDKAQAVIAGFQEMLSLTRRKIGADRILLANGLRATDYRQILDWDGITGVMIEHFGHFTSGSKEDMKADLESLALAEAKDKFVVLKGWPSFNWLDADKMKQPHDALLKKARENIVFPLACFLVGAQSRSWFGYSWGYRDTHGMLDAYPEFAKPLGAPKGEAAWDGFTATREFAHASVWVNLAAKQARIEWR